MLRFTTEAMPHFMTSPLFLAFKKCYSWYSCRVFIWREIWIKGILFQSCFQSCTTHCINCFKKRLRMSSEGPAPCQPQVPPNFSTHWQTLERAGSIQDLHGDLISFGKGSRNSYKRKFFHVQQHMPGRYQNKMLGHYHGVYFKGSHTDLPSKILVFSY